MHDLAGSSHVIRFGVFEVNLRAGELRKKGVKIKLQEQPFQVLTALLEQAGDVVARDELRRRIWPAETFVDFDHGLNKAINKLREALGDSAVTPRYIETLSRRGYRFIYPLINTVGHSSELSEPCKIRLAVLPFENLGDPEQDYFSDGMTEEMIAQLGTLKPQRLGVIARTSAMQYKRTCKSIGQIAEELGVDYVLEGTVRRSGPRVRITAKLIQAVDQTHLWAETYEREASDVMAIQNEVAQKIGQSLACELLPESEAAPDRPRVVPPLAHEAYLRGRFHWNQRSEKSLKQAIESFEEALKQDPNYALAYAGLADCYAYLSWFGTMPPRQVAPKAKQAAHNALAIDDRLPEAHTSLGLMRFWYDWNWPNAEKEFQRAIELNPNYPAAHHWYGSFLCAMGRLIEAAIEQQRAQELDPLSLAVAKTAGDSHYFGRRYDQAIQRFEAVLARDPKFVPAHFDLGRARLLCGMHHQAIAAFERAHQLSGGREVLPFLAHAHASAGNTGEARRLLREVLDTASGQCPAPPAIALVYLGLGDSETALDWLEKGFEERSCWMIFLGVEPAYDRLATHPRFRRLLTRLNLIRRDAGQPIVMPGSGLPSKLPLAGSESTES
ncbi:MAG TPA: tetratricopeptide repeat protein [Terriglobales bacterium]|nr:tetratricopeptide repeat protein [Terriglobales bacterium]